VLLAKLIVVPIARRRPRGKTVPKKLPIILFPLTLVAAIPATATPAFADSPACIAANGQFIGDEDGEGQGSPLSEPISWGQFEVGEVVTVVITKNAPYKIDGEVTYWNSYSADQGPKFSPAVTDSEIFDSSSPVGSTTTFTLTVTQEIIGSGATLSLDLSYGAITVSCGATAGEGSAIESIQKYGTLIAAQQGAAATVSSVRSQISSRLSACMASSNDTYTKDAVAPSCPLDTTNVDVWASATQTGFVGDQDSEHQQFNGFLGIDTFITNDLVAGVFAGYEYSNSEFDKLNGELDGGGQSVGAYMAYALSSAIRLDVGVSYSWLAYDLSQNLAEADMDASRTVVFGGLTGAVDTGSLRIEPTADLLAIWQNEDGYTDNFGFDHAERSFTAIRASAGGKFSLIDLGSENWAVTPYAGLYGDYWSIEDDAELSTDAFGVIEDLSGRVNAGLSVESRSHALVIDLSVEYSGIGQDAEVLNGKAGLTFGF
jgi:outer membrane autotransporter protein